ncbi:uncharacterized protein LACBIDRAFT_312988 [Laccaria bicolor S238N-H82]|uniref:Predicted protein n=1 Tax=Laccaria bicolor (strain S238N-H82 / ATCC MYA-4686) TaxID=486041 RepID=B0DXA6_LACBS|nr:uncharacterized protein LACBIDRAFT_312988 [Laccaria bicolor S238N-H82]EDR00800.1 predicted protein [Laccaria bicolor S238N-H82]|eukprot:XP_001888592.1 predicted protein [Laccaria bicolor S238N-H82]
MRPSLPSGQSGNSKFPKENDQGRASLFSDDRMPFFPLSSARLVTIPKQNLLGVHSNGLTHLVFMPPTRISTVIEIVYPPGFTHDYQWMTRALGCGMIRILRRIRR